LSEPRVFATAMESLSPVLEAGTLTTESVNRAEMALTFIRNILIIDSDNATNMRVLEQLRGALFFELLASIQLTSLGNRARAFASAVVGVFSGCFGRFRSGATPASTGPDSRSTKWREMLQPHVDLTSARHGHWGGSFTQVRVERHAGDGGKMKIKERLVTQGSLTPHVAPARSKARPRIPDPPRGPFVPEWLHEIAVEICKTRLFIQAYEFSWPKDYNGQARSRRESEELRLADGISFFLELMVDAQLPEAGVRPLATERVVEYFTHVAEFWLSKTADRRDGVTRLQAQTRLIRLYTAFVDFLSLLVLREDMQNDPASVVVQNWSAQLQVGVLGMLSAGGIGRKPIRFLADAIKAIDSFVPLYQLGMAHELIQFEAKKVKSKAIDDEAYEEPERLANPFHPDMVTAGVLSNRKNFPVFWALLRWWD
jgi:hypothetical protein